MPDPDPSYPWLLAAFVALCVRALGMAGEAALGGVGLERAGELARRSRAGRMLERLKQDPERSLGGVQALRALTLVLAAGFTTHVALSGASAVAPLTRALAASGAVWLWTLLTDVLPQSVAASHPERWALATAPLLLAARGLFAPITALVARAFGPLLRSVGVRTSYSLPPPPLEELQRQLMEAPPEPGAPEPALVESLFSFGERTVKEIMVPRTDVTAIPHDASVDEILRLFVEDGHTRLPVYRDTLDTVVGLVHVKDVLPLIAHPELIILHDLLRPTTFVPWNTPIPRVMRDLQRQSQHFAVVVDEYGGVAGIVTLEDIVEQIVGDIRDEFDEEQPDVTPEGGGTSLVRGEMRVAEFNDAFGADVPQDQGFETMGGFLSSLSGAIPSESDRFFHGGLEFEVVRRDPRRVLEIRVQRTAAAPAQPSAAEHA
ncbi:MAG: hypothetical protein RL199_623 [Pseudomonadota bacterium]